MTLPDGLYDLLVTEGLASRLDLERSDVFALKGGAAELLADAMARQLAAILDDVAGDDNEKALRQLELVNALLVSLAPEWRVGQRGGLSDLWIVAGLIYAD